MKQFLDVAEVIKLSVEAAECIGLENRQESHTMLSASFWPLVEG